ncbi:MAG TPA: branched-chain amino acid ABC transporter permease [Acetobacteraceae bacterium]|jgi:branched-chain amino acid transport system permease protein|nr:branched-chain amino acid ABC transporter permease [Acetobacteraceae bacterium]
MDLVLQQVINGLTMGAIYAIVGLGYTMVYGIIRLINFAHGAVFMVGAYLGLTLLEVLGGAHPAIGIVPALLIALALPAIACAGLGFAMDALVYRRLRAKRAHPLIPLIAALGISLMLETAAMLVWGKEFKVYPAILPVWHFHFAGAVMNSAQVMLLVICFAMMIGLHLFVQHTRIGRAMRAAALDPNAARLVGVNVDQIIMLTFVIGSALAAVAGVLVGLYYGSVNFRMGYVPGLKAFTAAVLGGVGNIPGAMIGGLIIGLLETFGAAYISGEWKDAIAFIILITVIVARPTGLLGERIAERA